MNYNSFINNDFDPEVLRRALRRQRVGVAQQGFIRGRWTGVQAWKGRPNQSELLWSVDFPNGITDEGIHHALDRFTDITGPEPTLAPWHAGLIDNASFTGVDTSDTMASHTGWIENQDFSESVRQQLNFSAAATRTISDSVSFSINATVTIRGLFVTSDNTKGGTSGTLFSTALFATPPSLVSGNSLTANYSLSD
jgi:hypothetical protein